MALRRSTLLAMLLVFKYANTAPADETAQSGAVDTQELEKEDLKTSASNAYPDRYSNWGRSPSSYGGSYGVTGYGTVDNRYNYGGIGSSDNSYGYNTYDNGYSGYSSGYGGVGSGSGGVGGGYGGVGGGYGGVGGGYRGVGGGYGGIGSGYRGAGSGYGSVGTGYGDVGSENRGYTGGSYGYSGNGGYGGYSGNGGLNSYYGYNNPYYQGSNHIGYGYYKRAGTGIIYNSGITPNLVTGYRGYSRK